MRAIAPLLAALALGLAACGSDSDEAGGEGGGEETTQAGETTEAAGETVTLEGTEFAFDPSSLELASGTHTFRLVNAGGQPHALTIDAADGELEEETAIVQPGEEAELTVDLPAGEYELYCPVGNHRDQGMEGTLLVGAAAGGAGAGTDETTTDETTTDDEGPYDY